MMMWLFNRAFYEETPIEHPASNRNGNETASAFKPRRCSTCKRLELT
jgi:hypothetical protein